jgi:hypothetical protein
LLLLAAGFFQIVYLKIFLTLVLAKGSIELCLLLPVTRFFAKRHELYYFFILQFAHIPYIIISALLSQFGTYQWKDRQVK